MNPYIPTVPVCWYAEDDWGRLQAIVRNSTDFTKSYREWLDNAEFMCATLARHGIRTVRIPIAAERFARWCRIERRDPDRAALLAFSHHLFNTEFAHDPGQAAERQVGKHQGKPQADDSWSPEK